MAAERKAEQDKAAAERRAEEDRELAEEQLLEEAAAIRRLRDSLARPAPPTIEPKRPKTHWDHLLEEMAWLAKEFQKCACASDLHAHLYAFCTKSRACMPTPSLGQVRQGPAVLNPWACGSSR